MQIPKLSNNKRGQLQGAQNIAIGLVILVLIVAVGAIVLGDFQSAQGDDNCLGSSDWTYNESTDNCVNGSSADPGNQTKQPDSADYNASADGLTGLTNMSTQFGTVGTVAIAAVLISLVVGAFAIGGRR